MNWGKKIILAYVIFILGIGSFVFISMRQKIDLVTENYYEKEIKYQDEIDKKNRVHILNEKVTISKNNNELQIIFPDKLSPESGEILFYRPSDKSQDKILNLERGMKEQKFKIENFQMGLWKVKINWKSTGTEYMVEDTFFLTFD